MGFPSTKYFTVFHTVGLQITAQRPRFPDNTLETRLERTLE